MVEDGHLEAEGGSDILQCEGTRVWRDRWLERKFTSVHPETEIKK
jgi:hypothetical protein